MFSQHLMNYIREIRQSISPVNLEDPAVFRRNLMFVAQVIKATPGLMSDGLKGLQGEFSGFSSALFAYLRDHSLEEEQHYEWLMRDLDEREHLGQIDWIAAEMVGAQYYMTRHWHPATLLGYMAVLEGEPTSMAVVERMEAIHGKSIMRCIRYHAVEDLEHRKALFKIIDMVPSSLQSVVMESALHTLKLYEMAQKTWEK